MLQTGVPSIDIITNGGLPPNSIVEFFGNESCGKSTLALQIISNNPDKRVLFLDNDYSIDVDYATMLGVDLNNLVVCQPEGGDKAFNIIIDSLQYFDLIIVDSIAVLAASDDEQYRFLNNGLNTIDYNLKGAILLFTNQIRTNFQQQIKPGLTSTGGASLKYFTDYRFYLSKNGKLRWGDSYIGENILIQLVKDKNRFTRPSFNIDLNFGYGFDLIGDLLNVAIKKGVVTLNGNWYYFNKIKLGNGKNRAVSFLKKHNGTLKEINYVCL